MKNNLYLLNAILFIGIVLNSQLCCSQNIDNTKSSIQKEIRENNREWIFKIEGIIIDSLKARFSGNLVNNLSLYFEKRNDNDWSIHVPDSIYYRYDKLDVSAYRKNKEWCDVVLLDSSKFVKYNVFNVLFFSDKSPIKLEASLLSVLEDESIALTTSYLDTEYVNGKKMATLYSEMIRNEISQEEVVETIINYTKATPCSYAIMKMIAGGGYPFDEVKLDTVKKLYSLFTNPVKQTVSGKNFELYIKDKEAYESNNKIQVFNLPRCDNDLVEPFINNDEKYKLIIFSSFGCAPCHKIIPVYKEIYHDLSDKLDMVYISVDDRESSKLWLNVLENHEIPWRSYFSYDIEGGILQKYMIRFIPSALLVYPDMTFKKIDLRKDDEKRMLYQLMIQ